MGNSHSRFNPLTWLRRRTSSARPAEPPIDDETATFFDEQSEYDEEHEDEHYWSVDSHDDVILSPYDDGRDSTASSDSGSADCRSEDEVWRIATPLHSVPRDSTLREPLRHRALLIGINYADDSDKRMHLRGCVNDAKRLTEFICKRVIDCACGAGGDSECCEVRILCDVPDQCQFSKHFQDLQAQHRAWLDVRVLQRRRPTRAEIERQLHWLVEGADERTHLWFSYSGHGHSVRDRSGDESDRKDEVLVPLDYQSAGFVTDDWLRANVVDRLMPGVQMTCLVDACHSGTSFDLRIALQDRSRLRSARNGNRKRDADEQQRQRYERSEWLGRQNRTENAKQSECDADVLMISGCQDQQTSADAWEEGAFTGALTHAFLLYADRCETALQLLQDMSVWLRLKKYTQRPVLSFGSRSAEERCCKRLQLF